MGFSLILSVLTLHPPSIPSFPTEPTTLFFSGSLYRWKASSFSVNGLQSSELNIDFIGSLSTAFVMIHGPPPKKVQISHHGWSQGEEEEGDESQSQESWNRGEEKKDDG